MTFVTTAVDAASKVTSVAAGATHTLWLLEDGSVVGFGSNLRGQLGQFIDGEERETVHPVLTPRPIDLGGVSGTVERIVAGEDYTLLLTSNGVVYGLGDNRLGQLGIAGSSQVNVPTRINIDARVIDVAAGRNHSLFLLETGQVFGCGNNASGQLGISPLLQSMVSTPQQLSAVGANITMIRAGVSHSLFLNEFGDLTGVGRNAEGQLNRAPFAFTSVPVQLMGETNTADSINQAVAYVDAGDFFTVWVTVDGKVYGSGYNAKGQLGNGGKASTVLSEASFTALPNEFTKVAAGSNHTLLLNRDGQVYVVGSNEQAQLGLGAQFAGLQVTQPTLVEGLAGITDLFAGNSFTMLLDTEGQVLRSGQNTFGQLGTGDLFSISQFDVLISPLTQVITYTPPDIFPAIGASPWQIPATASSGLPLTYQALTGNVVVDDLGMLTVTAGGEVKVLISQLGDLSGSPAYYPAEPRLLTFTPGKRQATIIFDNLLLPDTDGPLTPTYRTIPEGLEVAIEFTNRSSPPSFAGSFPFTANVVSDVYEGSASGTLEIGYTLNYEIEEDTSGIWGGGSIELTVSNTDIDAVAGSRVLSGNGEIELPYQSKVTLKPVPDTVGSAFLNWVNLITDSTLQAETLTVEMFADRSYRAVFGPDIRFIEKNTAIQLPNTVEVFFELQDTQRNGISLSAQDLLTQLSAREGGVALAANEVAYSRIEPETINTVLLLDNTLSMAADIGTLKAAVGPWIDRLLDNQSMAIYTFAGVETQLQGKTQDKELLKASLDQIQPGIVASGNLYAPLMNRLATPDGLDGDLWTERYETGSVETGYIILLTDGKQQYADWALDDVLARRDGASKRIITIGLRDSADEQTLEALGNAGYFQVDQASDLSQTFLDVQAVIASQTSSIYRMDYASPSRGDAEHSLSLSFGGNLNSSDDAILETTFNSRDFRSAGEQKITVTPVATKRFGENDNVFQLEATATSGLDVSFRLLSGPAQITETGQVTIQSIGTVFVEAFQRGGGEFAPAQSVRFSFEVIKGLAEVIFPAAEGGQITSVLGAASSVNFETNPAGLDTVITYDGQAAYPSAGGSYVVEVVVQDDQYDGSGTVTLNLGYRLQLEVDSAVGRIDGANDDDIVLLGDTITLTAVPLQSGMTFARWSSSVFDAGFSQQNPLTVTIDGETTIAAEFGPSYTFNVLETTTSAPSVVNAWFQITDNMGEGVVLADVLLAGANPELFQLTDDGQSMSVDESLFSVTHQPIADAALKTVLMLDVSRSMASQRPQLIAAVEQFIDAMLPSQQIAICEFSDQLVWLHAFSDDKQSLKASLQSLSPNTATTTDLYNNLMGIIMGGHPALADWAEQLTPSILRTGNVVVFTDGDDQSGLTTLDQVVTERDQRDKQIYFVGLGDALGDDAFDALGNGGYYKLDETPDISVILSLMNQRFENKRDSVYQLVYHSPRRGDSLRTLDVAFVGNLNEGPNAILSTTYNSSGFTNADESIFVNMSAIEPTGISVLHLNPGDKEQLTLNSIVPGVLSKSIRWVVTDPSLIEMASTGRSIGHTAEIRSLGIQGSTMVNILGPDGELLRQLPVIIGSGETTFDSYMRDLGLSGTASLPGSDADEDGYSNLIEYAFASSPVSSTEKPLYFMDYLVGGSPRLLFFNGRNDILYQLQGSADLSMWLNVSYENEAYTSTGLFEYIIENEQNPFWRVLVSQEQ